MARLVNILTPRGIAALLAPGEPTVRGPDGKPKAKVGVHADGQRLYLRVRPDGVGRDGQGYVAHWVFQYRWGTGKNNTQTMGLGGWPAVTLAKAREKAKAANDLLAAGINPLAAKRTAPEVVPTFADVADEWFETKKRSLTAKKNVANYERWLTKYLAPLRDKRVSEITTDDVLKAINANGNGLWVSNNDSARDALRTLRSVLDLAKVRGHRTGDNPAQWKGHLEHILPKQNRQVQPRVAADYEDMPAVYAKLLKLDGVAARALEFTLLNADRSGEVIGDSSHGVLPMMWGEVNFVSRMWVIPAHRMKEREEHQVPLTPRAIEILKAMHELRWNDEPTCPVFIGMKDGTGLNSNAMLPIMKRLYPQDPKVTVHGTARSSFKDWCADETDFADEVSEEVLSHNVGSDVRRAYRRRSAIEKRRALLNAWHSYLSGKTALRQREAA